MRANLSSSLEKGAMEEPTHHAMALHDTLHHYVMNPNVTAVRSGPWSQGSTWSTGSVPAALAKVAIPSGITVTVDGEIANAVDWIRVSGLLRFQPDTNTALTVNTIVVMDTGAFEIGTAAQPVTSRAILTLSSLGRDLDHSKDPLELTLGLIAMGPVRMNGLSKTSWVPISLAPQAGQTRVRPDSIPSGWVAGDKLVLTASTYGQEEDLTFQRIENGEIVFAEPLKNARVFPASGLSVHIGNLSRNVLIRSNPIDAGNVKRQAHMMLMSDPNGHDIRFAEFRDMGRTTISPVTDPSIVPNIPADQILAMYGKALAPGTRDAMISPPYINEENTRGRYPVHFHHVGERTAPMQQYVKGISIHNKKYSRIKFGFVNHSSNVAVEDSVGYNFDGSTFMTEEGNEIGTFKRNLAVFSFGSNSSNEDQPRNIYYQNSTDPYYQAIPGRRRGDMGHNGTGFWVHSSGIDVVGNVAAGHTNAGFDFWTTNLSGPYDIYKKPYIRFETKYLRPGSTWPEDTMPIVRVPAYFKDNTAYAAGFQRNGRQAGFALSHGLLAMQNADILQKTLVDGFLAWNVLQGVDSEYTAHTIWRNVRLIAGNRAPGHIGLSLRRQANSSNNDVHTAQISGFTTCIWLGDNSVTSDIQCDGGTLPPTPAPTPVPPSATPAPTPTPPTATPSPTAPPTTGSGYPTNLTLVGRTSTSVTLSWTGVTGAVGYGAYVGDRLAVSTNLTTATVGNLPCNKGAYFFVDAVFADGSRSVKSSRLIAGTLPCDGTTPTPMPATSSIGINGGGSGFVSTTGARYGADAFFTGGKVYSSSSPISGTEDDAIYQSERYGAFSYRVPLANGRYGVKLRFSEIYFSAAGLRIFNVRAEGLTAISNLDIFSKVGANTAYDVDITVEVKDGILDLDFVPVVQNPKVGAILITPL